MIRIEGNISSTAARVFKKKSAKSEKITARCRIGQSGKHFCLQNSSYWSFKCDPGPEVDARAVRACKQIELTNLKLLSFKDDLWQEM
jgi:hypothetical protein